MTVEQIVNKQNSLAPANVEVKNENKIDINVVKKIRAEETIKMQKLAQACQAFICFVGLFQYYRTGDSQEFFIVSAPLTCLFERGFLSFNRLLFLKKGDEIMVDAIDARVPQHYSFLTKIGNNLILNPIKTAITSFCGCGRRN